MGGVSWKRVELAALVLYALGFYLVVIQRSLRLSHESRDCCVVAYTVLELSMLSSRCLCCVHSSNFID
nr:unnamed protein product [Digitaria exilis]